MPLSDQHTPNNIFDASGFKIQSVLPKPHRTFLAVGTKIGKYSIIEEIDRGGMAVVYKATQLDLNRVVALKVLPANITLNQKYVDRFLSEAHAVARLNHPNIVSIHEVAVENNIYYIAMDYIPGKNLYYYLHFNKPKLVEVIDIIVKLASALSYAHQQKIIHRDLKLNNVIMKDPKTPILIDFGLAKAMEDGEHRITRTGEIVGSPAYMAPERLLGAPADHRSDICSLGIMLYEMITFKNPYLDQRSIHQTTINVIEANPIPPRKLVPWLSADIEAITLKAMAKDVKDRYQTMDEFKEDLQRFQKGEPVLAHPPSIWVRIWKFIRKYWALHTIFMLTVFFSTLLFFVLHHQQTKAKSYWQLLFQDNFNSANIGPSWYAGDDKSGQRWSIVNGSLEVKGGKKTYLRLEKELSHDIIVEFETWPVEKDFYDLGFFFLGNTPDSAYCFHIFRNGKAECGITFPQKSFLLYNYNPLKMQITNKFKIVFEKSGNCFTFKINDILIAKIWDHLPPLGASYQRLGFFASGSSAAFDNFRIYRKATPMVSGPTVAADRFMQRGEIANALSEYRELLFDFSSSNISTDILIKMLECQVRLKQPKEALQTLEKLSAVKELSDENQAKASFLKATLYKQLGMNSQADSAYTALALKFPLSNYNQSALLNLSLNAMEQLKQNKPAQAEETLFFVTKLYPKLPSFLGRMFIELIKHYADKGNNQKALELSEKTLKLFESNLIISSQVRTLVGNIYLNKKERDHAIYEFNRCIAAYSPVSIGMWEAWMAIASIYERMLYYKDAHSIYLKVFLDCPRSIDLPWMAGLQTALIADYDSLRAPADSILKEIDEGTHPFPVPRMLARYYRGIIDDKELKQRWTSIKSDDKGYLYHFAQKALFQGNPTQAKILLGAYHQSLPPKSWECSYIEHLVRKAGR